MRSSDKTIVLGAGPSGLGVAWGLVEKGHRNILIVEKANQVGGLSGSLQIGDNVVDYGPHRLSPEYPDIVERARKLLGDDLLEVPNDHAVAFRNKLYRYPPKIIDFLNFDSLYVSTQVLTSWLGRKLSGPPSSATNSPEATFEQIIQSDFGPAFYEWIIRPMCLKIWGDPATIAPSFAKLRFSIPTFIQWFRKLIHHSSTFNDKVFYYPKYGFQQLWTATANHLRQNGVTIQTRAYPTSIQINNERIQSVSIQKGEKSVTYPCKWLISTIPTQQFLRLLNPNPFDASELLGHSFVNLGVIFVAFQVKKPKVLPARVIIVPELKYRFNRICEQNQFSPHTVQEGHSMVIADVITDIGSDVWNMNEERLIQEVRSQVLSLGLFKEAELTNTYLYRASAAYPKPTIEREQAQLQFNERLKELRNLLCTGRFASSDYNNSHTALKKGLLAADVISDELALQDWYNEAEKIRQTAIRD